MRKERKARGKNNNGICGLPNWKYGGPLLQYKHWRKAGLGMLGLNGFRDRYNELKPSVGSSVQSASQERILGFYPELGFTCVRMRAEAMGATSRSVD